MIGIAVSIFSLLLATAFLLLGIGLQGTLLGLRATHEQFPITDIGYVMSSYFVGFALGTYVCPPIIRRVGHIRAYAAMAAVTSSAAIAYVMVINPYIWSLFRVITGTCMVGLYMTVESWLNVLAPNNVRGQFFSAYMFITFLALAISQYLLLTGDIANFTLFAVSSILMSTALIPITLTRVQQPQLIETPRLHLATVYSEAPLGIIGTLTSGIVMGAFWGMMPVYATQIGMNSNGVASLMSATIFGGAILQWPIGKISDRMDRRIMLSISAFAASLLSLLGFFYGESSSFSSYAIFFLYGGFAFSLYSLSVAHVNDRLRPEQALDASKTLLQLYGIGAVAGPTLVAFLMKTQGPHTLPLFFTIVLLVLGLSTLFRIFSRAAVATKEQVEFITIHRTSPVVLQMDPRSDSETGAEKRPNNNNEK